MVMTNALSLGPDVITSFFLSLSLPDNKPTQTWRQLLLFYFIFSLFCVAYYVRTARPTAHGPRQFHFPHMGKFTKLSHSVYKMESFFLFLFLSLFFFFSLTNLQNATGLANSRATSNATSLKFIIWSKFNSDYKILIIFGRIQLRLLILLVDQNKLIIFWKILCFILLTFFNIISWLAMHFAGRDAKRHDPTGSPKDLVPSLHSTRHLKTLPRFIT
jgi:hypothetical protein